MQTSCFRAILKYGLVVLALVVAQSGSLWGQETSFPAALKTTSVEVVPVSFVTVPVESRPHRFWDNRNRALFATAAALGVADFFVTRSNLASGGRELNPVTRMFSGSTPGLAVNFSLETGSVIGVSYLFHKTGHHKLERIASVVNIGGSAAAVAYGLSHR